MPTYYTNTDALNAICISKGGDGGHSTNLAAINELCTLLSGEGGHDTTLPAFNELCTLIGGVGGHNTNLPAVNEIDEICGGDGDYYTVLDALNDIAERGLSGGLTITSGPTFIVAEGVGVVGTITTNKPGATFDFDFGPDDSNFIVGASTGVLSRSTILDFDNPTGSYDYQKYEDGSPRLYEDGTPMVLDVTGNCYQVKVIATLGSETATQTIYVCVTNVVDLGDFVSDAMFALSGEVVDVTGTKYLKDVTSNHRNFLITDYDFADTVLLGFPYRSKATISAPAGDTALIAADINNFLYDSGGNPNQIPVIALFQDVDYEHKIFCRHSAQTVDEVSGIMYEARVSEIIMYSAAKSGDELTALQSYCSVPTEDPNAKWVSKAGNDSTGNGSKASPYLTMEKAYKTFSVGTTVYVKTGSYTEEYNGSSIRYFYADKASGSFTFKGLGLVEMKTVSTSFVVRVVGSDSTLNLHRIIFNGETNTTSLIDSYSSATTSTCNLTSCLLKNALTNNIMTYVNANTHTYSLTDCVILDGKTITTYDSCSITGCYLNAYVTNCTTFNYNRVRNTANTQTVFMSGSAMEFKWNDVQAKYSVVKASTATADSTFNVLFNTMAVSWTSSIGSQQILIWVDNQYITPTIERNTITHTGTAVSDRTYLIYTKSCKNPVVQYNTTSIQSKVYVSTILFDPTGTFTGIVKFNYNNVTSNNETLIDVSVGDENVNQNVWNGSEVIGNKYVGYKANYPDDTSGVTVHAFMVNCGVNMIVKYNRIEKTLLGMVIKTGLQQAYTAAGAFYNIFSDCKVGLWMRGVSGMKVYNNTIHHSSTVYAQGYSIGILADENSVHTGNFSENIILRNNIFDVHVSGGEGHIKFDNHAAANGCNADYNRHYGGNVLVNAGTTYASVAAAQAAGLMSHSDEGDPSLTNFIPATALAGTDLGSDYNTGLDIASVIPTSIVTKTQGATWQKGAFIK